MSTLFNEKPKEEYVEEPYKQVHISAFAFVDAINYSKEQLIVDEWSEKQYHAFVINKSLSFGADTVIFANEMNSRHHLDGIMQNAFLLGTVRPRKRYNKWEKKTKDDDVALVKAHYNYSTKKALDALVLLSEEQLSDIKRQRFQGGRK